MSKAMARAVKYFLEQHPDSEIEPCVCIRRPDGSKAFIDQWANCNWDYKQSTAQPKGYTNQTGLVKETLKIN